MPIYSILLDGREIAASQELDGAVASAQRVLPRIVLSTLVSDSLSQSDAIKARINDGEADYFAKSTYAPSSYLVLQVKVYAEGPPSFSCESATTREGLARIALNQCAEGWTPIAWREPIADVPPTWFRGASLGSV